MPHGNGKDGKDYGLKRSAAVEAAGVDVAMPAGPRTVLKAETTTLNCMVALTSLNHETKDCLR